MKVRQFGLRRSTIKKKGTTLVRVFCSFLYRVVSHHTLTLYNSSTAMSENYKGTYRRQRFAGIYPNQATKGGISSRERGAGEAGVRACGALNKQNTGEDGGELIPSSGTTALI